MGTQFIFNQREKSISINGVETKLTKKSFSVFYILIRNMNTMITKDTILLNVWEHVNYYTARSLDVYIHKLRKFLSCTDEIKIQTITGRGFVLIVDESVNIDIV